MLTIRCTLLRDVFEGGAPDDPRVAEWPPSWMRLFSALVAVAEPDTPDDDLLRLLEQAPPPHVHASPLARVSRSAFVPTNAVAGKPTGHTTMPGRTNSERSWARAVPKSPSVHYRWPGVDVPDHLRDALTSLCRRVPYLGRSTSPATVTAQIGNGQPTVEPEHWWLRPHGDAPDGHRFTLAATVRSPFPGALAALRQAHEDKYAHGLGGDPWAIGRGLDYGVATPLEDSGAVPGPYPTLVVFRLLGPQHDGRDTARICHAVRRAVMSRAREHLPALHGHHDGSTVQVAFLGLPFVGHPRADGHLLGVALALPDLPADQLAIVADALPPPGGAPLEVTAGPLGVLELERTAPLDAPRLPFALTPDRWQRPARTWATATPMVLDRFLKKGDDLAAEVRRAVVNSRLPDPIVRQVDKRPLVHGALDLKPRDTLRRPEDRAVRPYRHVLLEFPEAVTGPVVVGSMRHYGLGLCVPVSPEGQDG